ncbi:MAG: ribosome-associated translation inhibitor RaiA [Chlamydiales bacterium]|nr:ribosome-associated translation inhibitor RaiA [Chlamydiales bacterium]
MARNAKILEANKGFNITVTGRNVHVTEPMKDYALEKISKIERFSDRIIDAMVTMDIQKLDHKVDIVLKVNHWIIKSSAVTTQMYASIDEAVHKLERQLQRHKKRIQEHQAKGLRVIDMNVNVIQSPYTDLDEINDEIDAENRRRESNNMQPHHIVARETRALKTLSYEEAMTKMELSRDLFLVFRNEQDQKLKVMYRRSDGHFGVQEPEA